MPKRKKAKSYTYRKNKKPNPNSAVTLLTFGVLIVFLSFLTQVYSDSKLSFTTNLATANTGKKTGTIPTFLQIPKINISLSIHESFIKNGIWEISSDGISHLSASASPGQQGNIVLYSYNTKNRFGDLPMLSKNDTILLTSKDGSLHEYKVEKTSVVNPTESAVVEQTKDEVLTLYTSIGFADLKRFVVQAKPV